MEGNKKYNTGHSWHKIYTKTKEKINEKTHIFVKSNKTLSSRLAVHRKKT